MQFCNEHHVMFVLLALWGGGAGSLIVTWMSKVVLEIRCIPRAGVYQNGWRRLYGSKYVLSSKVGLKFRGTGGNFI